MLLTLFQILLIFSNNFSSFIKKQIHLFLSNSFSYALIFWEEFAWKSIFWPIKYLKPFFAKRDLIRYHYFIDISIFCQNRSFVLIKVLVSNSSIIRLDLFLYMVLKVFLFSLIYNFLLFLLKYTFWSKTIYCFIFYIYFKHFS